MLLTRDWECALEICFPFGRRPLRRHECDFTRDAIDHRNSRGKRSVLAMTIWPYVHAILGIICLLPGDFPGEQTSAPGVLVKRHHPALAMLAPLGR